MGWVGGSGWGTRIILYKILLYLSYINTSTIQNIKRGGVFLLSINEHEKEILLNVADEDIPTKKISPANTKKKRTKPFIKGPIDLDWISRVATLSGKSLNVGLALMYLKGLTKSAEDLRLTQKHLKLFNVTRKAANRVLNLMEEAGLIKIKKVQGRKHRIDIVEGDDQLR